MPVSEDVSMGYCVREDVDERTFLPRSNAILDAADAVSEPALSGAEALVGGCEVLEFLREAGLQL